MRNLNFLLLLFLLIGGQYVYCQHGYLKITLDMDGDELHVDNLLEKRNIPKHDPFVLELSPGNHIIKLVKEGYVDEINSINIKVDEVTKLNIHFRKVSDILLKGEETGTQIQAYGKLTILSNPPGANILIDGKPWRNAKTPDTFEKMPTGTYKIGVELNGIKSEKFVKIEKNKTTKVSFEVKDKKGKLNVTGIPSNSSVYINNSFFKRTPFIEEIRFGNYNISIKSDNFINEDYKINIYENKYTIINFDLKKQIPHYSEATIEDINRSYKKKRDYKVYRKVEYKSETINRKKRFVNIGLGMMGTGLTLGVIGGGEKGTLGTIGNVTMLSGLIPIIIGLIIKNKTVNVPLYDNIEYNSRVKSEIADYNKKIEEYNKETERLLSEENKRRQEEIIRIENYNKGRETTITVK